MTNKSQSFQGCQRSSLVEGPYNFVILVTSREPVLYGACMPLKSKVRVSFASSIDLDVKSGPDILTIT